MPFWRVDPVVFRALSPKAVCNIVDNIWVAVPGPVVMPSGGLRVLIDRRKSRGCSALGAVRENFKLVRPALMSSAVGK
jgi:hypothetical protein